MIFCSDISKPEVAPHSGAQHVGALDACQGSSCRTGKERRTLCPTLLHHLRTPAAKPFSIVGCYLRRKSSHEFCPNVIHVWENMHANCERKEWAFTWMIIDLSLYIYRFTYLSLFLSSFCLPIYMHRIKLQFSGVSPPSARLLAPYLVLWLVLVCLSVYVSSYLWLCVSLHQRTLYVCMYVMYVCMYVCLCVCLCVCLSVCLSVCMYVWLCMVMYGYVWLCMVMYGYVWLCMVMYGYVWLCMVMYGYVW